MSFLSRKPARPSGRGREDEYDDLDGYAHDGYQSNDDGWSPGEYFSPEGIKGHWAGEHPEGRSGGRGQRESSRADSAPGSDGYGDDFRGPDYGNSPGNPPGYGSDEFASGAYDLPEGADERVDRTRRRRKDKEDRGERTGILRLRRDRGEDIWPDDGISDEDYWASVAADRPLNGTDSPLDDALGADGPARPGADPRPRADARPPAGGADPRLGDKQRGTGQRGGGRLGPPPGLAGDHKPVPPGSPPAAGGGGRPGSGPMTARPATGPLPARGLTGPIPNVGVTASRPPQNGMRPGAARPASGPNRLPQQNAQPSFQPSGAYPTSGQGPASSQGKASGGQSGRPQDRADWGERTERIDRVNASGYPDPRPAGRGPAGAEPAARGAGYGPAASGPQGDGRSTGRHSSGSWQAPARREVDRREVDRREPERREPERREPERREVESRAVERRPAERRDYGRDGRREPSGAWPAVRGPQSRGGADDDPLTSRAYSRSANTETDGRSYRVAARRSQAQVKLSDSYPSGQYPQPGQRPSDEYWQYRDDAPATTSPAASGRYPATGAQETGGGSGRHSGRPAQPARSQAGPGRGTAPGQQQGQQGQQGREGRPAIAGPAIAGPGSGRPSGQYETPQPRPGQHRQPQHRQALPGANALPPGNSGAGGANPYDAPSTGGYPYAGQSYTGRQVPANPAQDGTDDRYYRPSQSDGYSSGRPEQARPEQGRNGYGYPTGDRPY